MAHVPLLAHGNAKIGPHHRRWRWRHATGSITTRAWKPSSWSKLIPQSSNSPKNTSPLSPNGAFDNPRTKVVIQDAAKYVKETKEKFDVIICDSCDPEGPAKVFFSTEFYGNCKKILNPDGIFVNQNGVPFMQKSELKLTLDNRKPHFKNVTFYIAPVPTYVGGFMAFGWASDKNIQNFREAPSPEIGKSKRENGVLHAGYPQGSICITSVHARLEGAPGSRGIFGRP